MKKWLRMGLIGASLLVGTGIKSHAQAQSNSAVVAALDQCETDQLKQLFDARNEAQAAFDKAYVQIVNKYERKSRYHEFVWGAQFTKDFKFMVPVAPPAYTYTDGIIRGSTGTSIRDYGDYVDGNGTVTFGAPLTPPHDVTTK